MDTFLRLCLVWIATSLMMAELAIVGGTMSFYAALHMSLRLNVDLEGGYGDPTARFGLFEL